MSLDHAPAKGCGLTTTTSTDRFDALNCTSCGYSLHALDRAGVCPECGCAVAESIEHLARREARFGPPLRAQSVAWLNTAGCGFFLFLLGGAICLAADLMMQPPRSMWTVIVGEMLSLAGAWLWTIRPLQAKRRGEALRWLSRLALSGWFIGSAMSLIGLATGHEEMSRAIQSMLWSAAIGTTGSLFYLAHLAGRMRRTVVRRVFLVLGFGSILMIANVMSAFSAIQASWSAGIGLPWPSYPIVGQVEELFYLRGAFLSVMSGRETLWAFVQWIGVVGLWCVASIAALLWYGLILIGTASRKAERDGQAA